jgi:Dyp-type peroxidase family
MSEVIRPLFASSCTELAACDGFDFPHGKIHFGYTDGISQPTIKGGPPRPPDSQAPVEAYNVILTDDQNAPYNLPTPPRLGLNGSFGAFRILEQDVAGFEDFLQQQSSQIDPETLAAKMCGRWRTGTPLTLSPDTGTPDPPIPEDQLDNYDYVPSKYSPDAFNDKYGVRCPIGSHMRRSNPRSEFVSGGPVNTHRIVRRAISYGPPYDPNNPHDGIPRGLIGYFICAVLANQFEFLMSTWVNTGTFTSFLPQNSKDPLLGSNDPASSILDIPYLDQNNKVQHLSITNFERFITTRGGACCFLPGIAALGYIATAPLSDA